jgi:hypothetical protein
MRGCHRLSALILVAWLGVPGAARAQTGAAAPQPAPAVDPTLPLSFTLTADDRGPDGRARRPSPLSAPGGFRPLSGWTGRVDSSFVSSAGFETRFTSGATDGARTNVLPPDGRDRWMVRASATRRGPAGITFTGTVSGRRDQAALSDLQDATGMAAPAAGMRSLYLDPTRLDATFWDARFRAERAFDLGAVELRLFGEAHASIEAGVAAKREVVGARPGVATKPLSGRALRFGLVAAFD